MKNDISLTPFDITTDCPPGNKQIIQKIVKNLKNNLFFNIKPVTQHTLKKHQLSHHIPAIFLTTYQLNKNYIFQFTDEKNTTITHYNNHADCALEQIERLFINGHEIKQDRNKVSAIAESTFKLIKDSTPYLKEVKETTKQSINETLRQSIKKFENLLIRIAELRREIDDKTAADILTFASDVCYLYWLDNIEYINDARIIIEKIYEKETPSLEKQELQQLWDYKYKSPYYESILQISSTSINYIQAQHQKVSIYGREQTGSLSMTAPTNITSTYTSKENYTVPLGKQKSTLVPDKYLSGKLFNNKIV